MKTASRRQFWATAGWVTLAVASYPASARAAEHDVGAVEDLMREHGVLRRTLLVFRECVGRLRTQPASIDGSALSRAAKLFQDFGEAYHERKLEEAFIFPRVKKAGGFAGREIDVLISQHNRGREITHYIVDVTKAGRIGASNAEPLARSLEQFALMYENHAAREDTIVFPAWKSLLSDSELQDMGEKFEDIEKQQFGGDGFEKAAKEIGEIEQSLGLAELAAFTAPKPPHLK